MTAHTHEAVRHQHHHRVSEHPSMINFGMKVSAAITISLLLLVAIWYTVPSTLSPTRLSLDAFLSSPVFLEAHMPPINAPPQPSVSASPATNVTHEFGGPVSSVPVNISAYATDDEFSQFDASAPLPGAEGPSFSELFYANSDDSDVNPLDPEPLSPIASWRSVSGGSKYDYGHSPSQGPSPSPSHSSSNSSAPVEAPTPGSGEADDKRLYMSEDDLELYAVAQGPVQVPVDIYETELSSPAPSSSPSPDPSPSPSPAPAPLPGSLEEAPLPGSLEDIEPEPKQKLKGERYMFPMLSSFVGTGNQLMEYKSAAVIARTLNRTLCLVPFFGGPQRHFGFLGSNHYGLHIEDRYDLNELSRFVKFANIDECIQECNGTLHKVWKLRSSRSSDWSWWFPNIPSWETISSFDRQYGKWISPADISYTLGQLNEEPEARCVGMGGAFPGLRWRGAMWAASAYMIHTPAIVNASDVFQARALGVSPYLSVHWRFEESNCQGHQLGLCFTRCEDGALIGGGLQSPRYMELPTVMGNFRKGVAFHGAGLTREDLSAALYDKAVEQGLGSVYLSTDGWLRGNESRANIKWVVDDIRRRGLNVSGLWEIEGLPNFADGTFVGPKEMPSLFGLPPDQKVSNHVIALVEQEICARSVVFLGSGQSSWSLAVFDARRSRRRRLDLEESIRSNGTVSVPDMDEAVIEHLYEDRHAAGPACHAIRGGIPETYQDEAPDGWLDYEGCEKRIDLGGKCVRLVSGITI